MLLIVETSNHIVLVDSSKNLYSLTLIFICSGVTHGVRSGIPEIINKESSDTNLACGKEMTEEFFESEEIMIGDPAQTCLETDTQPEDMDAEPTKQQVDKILSQYKKEHDHLIFEVRENQQQLQRKMEESICRGLEGITKIRFGAQAKEYFEQSQLEHEDMKTEVLKIVGSAIQDTKQQSSATIAAHEDAQKQFCKEEMNHMKETCLHELTEVVGENYGKVVSALEFSQNQMMTNFADSMQNLVATVGGLTEAIATSQQKIAGGVTGAIEDMNVTISTAMKHIQPAQNENLSPQEMDICQSSVEPNRKQMKLEPKEVHTRTIKTKKQKMASDESSSDSNDQQSVVLDSDSDDDITPGTVFKTSSSFNSTFRKSNIPPFTDKESWQVWFTRFKEIAKRQGWSDEQKLDILLPKLQGEAGRFVYEQLGSKVRNNYKKLKRELTNRFRKVENPKTYGSLFSTRNQKATESVETYAAELKKLYDKAHAKRDAKTRDEDLLRRFLDGIQDNKASFHVEFVKDPRNIDEGVDEVINFQEVRKKQGKSARKIALVDYSSTDESDMEERVARAPGRPPKAQIATKDPTMEHDDKSSNSELKDTLSLMTEQLNQLKEQTEEWKEFQKRQSEQNENALPNTSRRFPAPGSTAVRRPFRPLNDQNSSNWQTVNRPGNQPRRVPTCFKCNQPGHYMKDCPLMLGQMQISSTDQRNRNWANQRPSQASNSPNVSENH